MPGIASRLLAAYSHIPLAEIPQAPFFLALVPPWCHPFTTCVMLTTWAVSHSGMAAVTRSGMRTGCGSVVKSLPVDDFFIRKDPLQGRL